MGTTITCYGGVNEVGGSKILVEDGHLRVFFDFGKSFGRYGDYFDGVFVRERATRGLLDPMTLGLIPPLEGLYREDLVPVFDPALVTTREEEYSNRAGRRRKRQYLERDAVRARADFWARFRGSPGYRDLRREGPAVDGIVLSHAHLDHSGDLYFVRSGIAVFSSRMSAFIAKAMQDSGKPGASGVVYANPHTVREDCLLTADKSKGYIWRRWGFLDGAPEGEPNPLNPFASARSFWIWPPAKQNKPSPEPETQRGPDGFRLKWWPVDHSLFGADGFLLESTAGPIAYTGDIRFHGRHGDLSRRFANELAEADPLTLLCEGTRAGIVEDATEDAVRDNCLAAVRDAEGRLVVADFAPRNIERLITFLHIAGETERRLLIQPKDAYMLAAMRLADPASIPDLEREGWLAVYDDPKGQQYKWEQITREACADRLFGPDEIKAHPGDYILAFSLWDMADLLDVEHILGEAPGGTYIYSNSKAYDEEQKVDLIRLWNWIGHMGMKAIGLDLVARDQTGRVTEVDVVPGYHASGHANGPELVEFVKTVRPKVLIPIHTEQPQWWCDELEGTGIQVEIPTYGEPIRVT